MNRFVSLNPELERKRNGDLLNTKFFECKIDAPADHHRLNTLFNYFMDRAEQCKADGNWNEFLSLHLPKYRESAFLEVSDCIPSPSHNRIVGQIWTDSEIIHSGSCFIASAARRDLPHRLWDVMKEDELAFLTSLPRTLTIYRCHLENNQFGLCWTLDREIAERFGYGYNWPVITTARACRDSVLGYFNRRGEDEIVLCGDSELEIVDVGRIG